MAGINPYVLFNGNCAEAFDHYRAVFGGDFMMRMTFGDMPAEAQCDAADNNRIGHVSLPIGASILMGSDCPPSMPCEVGNNFAVSFAADSKEDADRIYAGLSDGGTVTMPQQDMFWGAYFGMCTDKFGINWQVSYSANMPQNG